MLDLRQGEYESCNIKFAEERLFIKGLKQVRNIANSVLSMQGLEPVRKIVYAKV